MNPFEYLFALVSILIGLAIADLAGSLHRLIRARGRVRWDWLAAASAALAALLIFEFWWVFYHLGQDEVWMHYGAFILLAASLIGIFLLASAALPDDVPAEGVDLFDYYRTNASYFWSLFGVFVLLMIAVENAATLEHGHIPQLLGRSLLNVAFALVLFSLARIRRRLYHAVVVPILIAVLLVQWSQLRLA